MQLQKQLRRKNLKYRKNIISDANMLDSRESKSRDNQKVSLQLKYLAILRRTC